MSLSGWGNNLSTFSNVYNPENNYEIINIILKDKISNFITRGLGRSYGDSSLSENIISLKNYKKLFFCNCDISGTISSQKKNPIFRMYSSRSLHFWHF